MRKQPVAMAPAHQAGLLLPATRPLCWTKSDRRSDLAAALELRRAFDATEAAPTTGAAGRPARCWPRVFLAKECQLAAAAGAAEETGAVISALSNLPGSRCTPLLARLLGNGSEKLAESLRREFEVPEKRWWQLQVTALAKSGRFTELRRLSERKSPIGYAPFSSGEQRVRCLCRLRRYAEAIDFASGLKTDAAYHLEYLRRHLAREEVRQPGQPVVREAAQRLRALHQTMAAGGGGTMGLLDISFLSDLKRMNKRQVFYQFLSFGMIVSSALMIWKGLIRVASLWWCSPDPWSPGFYRGDLLFPHQRPGGPIRAGDIAVFPRIKGRDIPIVHRVLQVHERDDGYVKFLTKGDNNAIDDRGLYAPGQLWLEKGDVIGRAKGFVPYIGMVTIVMNDYPKFKYAVLGLLGIFQTLSSVRLNQRKGWRPPPPTPGCCHSAASLLAAGRSLFASASIGQRFELLVQLLLAMLLLIAAFAVYLINTAMRPAVQKAAFGYAKKDFLEDAYRFDDSLRLRALRFTNSRPFRPAAVIAEPREWQHGPVLLSYFRRPKDSVAELESIRGPAQPPGGLAPEPAAPCRSACWATCSSPSSSLPQRRWSVLCLLPARASASPSCCTWRLRPSLLPLFYALRRFLLWIFVAPLARLRAAGPAAEEGDKRKCWTRVMEHRDLNKRAKVDAWTASIRTGSRPEVPAAQGSGRGEAASFFAKSIAVEAKRPIIDSSSRAASQQPASGAAAPAPQGVVLRKLCRRRISSSLRRRCSSSSLYPRPQLPRACAEPRPPPPWTASSTCWSETAP
uniref:Signal peptidase complex catalytic subunit SEC11 n=1 Tax=Macrostomum lignano TaxID=282301 RepID=A0A1I8FHK1_9PLAT